MAESLINVPKKQRLMIVIWVTEVYTLNNSGLVYLNVPASGDRFIGATNGDYTAAPVWVKETMIQGVTPVLGLSAAITGDIRINSAWGRYVDVLIP